MSTLTPRIIGQAENAHRPVLDRVLARTATTFHQWVALTLMGGDRATVEREQVARRLADALKVDAGVGRAALAELIASGLLEERPGDGPRVGFTEAGLTRFRAIRGEVDAVVQRVYSDVPTEDLETAGRVLTRITARLTDELGRA